MSPKKWLSKKFVFSFRLCLNLKKSKPRDGWWSFLIHSEVAGEGELNSELQNMKFPQSLGSPYIMFMKKYVNEICRLL